MGSVPRQHVLKTLRDADVLVMPSDYEGLSQTILESMSMGVVPVVSKIPGSTDYIIRDGKEGFLCERGKPKLFAQKISELNQNRELLSKMSEAAIEENKISIQSSSHLLNVYLKIFMKLLKKELHVMHPFLLAW